MLTKNTEVFLLKICFSKTYNRDRTNNIKFNMEKPDGVSRKWIYIVCMLIVYANLVKKSEDLVLKKDKKATIFINNTMSTVSLRLKSKKLFFFLQKK